MTNAPATELVPLVEHDGSPPMEHSVPAPARSDEPHRTHLPRSLTARLVAGVTLLVVLVIATTGAATYYYLKHYLYNRLDQQVSAQADSVAQGLSSPYSRSSCDPSAIVCAFVSNDSPRGGYGTPATRQAQWIVLLSRTGTVRSSVTANTVGLKALNLSQQQRTDAVRPQHPNISLTTTDGAHLRVAFRSETGYVVVSGISTEDARETLHTLLLFELVIGAVGVLLALGLTAAGMRVGLGPLKRVTRTAQEVTAEMSSAGRGLDRRVPQTTSTTEVGQLATSFNTMLDKVEHEFTARRESEERMRRFLADASHELRTPLTSIRGYAELARLQKGRAGGAAAGDGSDSAGGAESTDADSVETDPGDAVDDSIGRIEAEGTRMSRLVEDLLLLARGDDDTAPATRAPVDLGAIAMQAVNDVRMAHPQRSVTCSTAANLIVAGDEDQLLRVLRNLVGNAAVHTAPGSSIAVTGTHQGATVVLQVSDEGPGLAPEDAAHVFERFWRADKARTRVRGGSGLGMSIVAQIVSAHGGQVYFDSSVAAGSTVTVVLPAAPTIR